MQQAQLTALCGRSGKKDKGKHVCHLGHLLSLQHCGRGTFSEQWACSAAMLKELSSTIISNSRGSGCSSGGGGSSSSSSSSSAAAFLPCNTVYTLHLIGTRIK